MGSQARATAVERPTKVARLAAGPVEYRLERRGNAAVVVLHGGHMRAGLALGEEVFADADYTVLAPSRPGYGGTPLTTGTSAAGFADVTRALCEHLGITTIAAVVGVSAGGRTATAMAARHPDLVERLILQSAVGPLPWPDRRIRLAGQVVFAGATERATWAGVRMLIRAAPDTALRLLLGGLSTVSARRVVAGLSPGDRATLLNLFTHMRSGSGFVADLRSVPDTAHEVAQPTLVIAARKDGAVPLRHAAAIVAAIRHAELVESQADTHFVWFGPDWPAITTTMRAFLARQDGE